MITFEAISFLNFNPIAQTKFNERNDFKGVSFITTSTGMPSLDELLNGIPFELKPDTCNVMIDMVNCKAHCRKCKSKVVFVRNNDIFAVRAELTDFRHSHRNCILEPPPVIDDQLTEENQLPPVL